LHPTLFLGPETASTSLTTIRHCSVIETLAAAEECCGHHADATCALSRWQHFL